MGDSSNAPESFQLAPPPHSEIRRAVAVMSGKGGVGKSTVAALVASALCRNHNSVGVLDADITGPSIPRLFGVTDRPMPGPEGMVPPMTRRGIKLMSLNLLLASENEPVIWRGPLIASAVRQFWSEVVWGKLDWLVVDLPPGTGDAPLTVLQSLPLAGVIMVSSPQDLAAMVVTKAVRMARRLEVPVLGLIENMSGFSCPKCGEVLDVFGPSQGERLAAACGTKLLARVPVDPELSRLGDRGEIENFRADWLDRLPGLLEEAANVRTVRRDES